MNFRKFKHNCANEKTASLTRSPCYTYRFLLHLNITLMELVISIRACANVSFTYRTAPSLGHHHLTLHRDTD